MDDIESSQGTPADPSEAYRLGIRLERQSTLTKDRLGLENAGTTFRGNASLPIHRWYPYVEGFSGPFVKSIIQSYQRNNQNVIILDPFCGSGTTIVEACLLGYESYGYDVNPFLVFATKVKTNASVEPVQIQHNANQVREVLRSLKQAEFVKEPSQVDLPMLFPTAFSETVLHKVLTLRKLIQDVPHSDVKDLFMFDLCSILVEVSNYRRGPDLAYKRKKPRDAPVFERFLEKVSQNLVDLKQYRLCSPRPPVVVCGDARKLDGLKKDSVNLIVTSPPYLNGTNYFRNTKLELWIGGWLTSKEQLHDYRRSAVTAGINDVFKSKRIQEIPNQIAELVASIDKASYDSRIPTMVATYFEDIRHCLESIYRVMMPGSKCYWVVGDSAFWKIRVPTDKITTDIARDVGLNHEGSSIVRSRKSRSGIKLHEVVIELSK
jgi:DNA modification methylase